MQDVDSRHDYHKSNELTFRVDCFDRCHKFSIIWTSRENICSGRSNDRLIYFRYVYFEARFVKVPDIIVVDMMFLALLFKELKMPL